MTGPAVPPGGEELRRQVAAIWTEGGDDAADAVLALPEMRDALAAQETLRSYANDPAPTSEQLRDLVIRNRELEAELRRAQELIAAAGRQARELRRALAGES